MQNGAPTQSDGTIVTELSFLTLQRRNAVRDALRHTVLRFSEILTRLEAPFRPSATDFEGSK
ncbi:hypothetical protein GCM10009085_39170 [Pseudomonas avellanae]|nr:hypothetical protein GCM10009085_39170 [Pseudomonas avellanae]